ncbi:MAG: hypothetical protein IT381_27945 [Deltaproteobacteria bacterium]|nr:hypothetical protein [Deltaproteobacteria bacterium]
MAMTLTQAIVHLGTQLGNAAHSTPRGIASAEVEKIAAATVAQLTKTDAQSFAAALSNNSVFQKASDDHFESVFGVSKHALLRALKSSVNKLTPAGGVTQTAGVDLAVYGLRNATFSDATRDEVNRFFVSPLPGEDGQTLARILMADPALASFGARSVDALAARLMQQEAPASLLLTAFVASGGKSGPAPTTLNEIAELLSPRVEPRWHPEFQMSAAAMEDRWIRAMGAHTAGSSARELAYYLLAGQVSDVEREIVRYFNPARNKARADTALRVVNDVLAAKGSEDIGVVRELPAPSALTDEDAELIAGHRVNDFRLEESHGRYTIAARVYDASVSDAHVTTALQRLVGFYGVSVRCNRGDWPLEQAANTSSASASDSSSSRSHS